MTNAVDRQRQSDLRSPQAGLRGSSVGYTLLEMLITMLVIALLSTLVGPSFIDTINRNRQQSALGDVFAMLSTARSEAVGRAATVVACGSSDQASCNSNNWENGWIIFADDGAGAGTADDGIVNGDEQLIRVGQEASGSMTIRTRGFPAAGAVAFNEDGFAEATGSFVVCDGEPAEASALVLNLSGQPRMAVDENANGFLNLTGATELTSCP